MDKAWIDEVVSQVGLHPNTRDYDYYDVVDYLGQTNDLNLEDLRKLSQYDDPRVLGEIIDHPLISEDLILQINNRIVPEMHNIYAATLSSQLCPKNLRMKILGTGDKIWEHLDDDEVARRIGVLETLWPTSIHDVRIQNAFAYVYLKQGKISEFRELTGVEEPTGKFIEKGVWDYGTIRPKKLKFPKEEELHELCRNPLTPSELLFQLTYIQDEYHEQAIACNPNAPLIALDYYASECQYGNLMSMVFSNPALPEYLFDQGLAEQDSSEFEILIHGQMAENVAIPNHVIRVLSKHKNPRIVRSLAGNPIFPGNTALEISETQKIMKLAEKHT